MEAEPMRESVEAGPGDAEAVAAAAAAAAPSLDAKFDVLSQHLEALVGTVSRLAERLAGLEEAGRGRRLAAELHALRRRVDELHAGADDDSGSAHDHDSMASEVSGSSKVAMSTGLDRESIRAAYEDVRSDATPTEWAVFKFDGGRVVCAARGCDFTEFRTQFADDERAFGYLRLQTGDEMSKRQKFLFCAWVGRGVSVIHRARMSTDRALLKDIISNFAVELQLESQAEIDIDQFKDTLNRAGGANYGTGIRDS